MGRAVSSATRAAAQRRVLRWFASHGRAFPWRAHRDPYATLVAEVMLQQTPTGRVAEVYPAFLSRFPSAERLAHAPAIDVIRAWHGLGYNRRAVDLQRAAQAVVHAGEFPSSVRALRALPGVAEYTASAVACFAFDAQVPVIDVNVRRVLARAVRGCEADGVRIADLRSTARAWLPAGEAYAWNQALMDVGALVCRTAQAQCAKCPLRDACVYHARGLDRRARVAAARTAAEPFNGSSRQKRGGVVEVLREAAAGGLTLARIARAVNHDGNGRDLSWLVELLEGLEKDGLIVLSPAARRASPRGIVKLPG